MIKFGLAEDHFDTRDDRLRQPSEGALNREAREHRHPDRMVWGVMGDRARLKDGIRELGLGETHLIHADGRVVDR